MDLVRISKRTVIASASAAAATLVAISLAWACTPPAPGSQTTINRTSGPGGTTITAKATGAPVTGKAYQLKFADSVAVAQAPIDACPHSVIIGGPTVATATGKIPATTGTIPATAALGNGQVCFAQKLDSNNWTAPATFTVAIV